MVDKVMQAKFLVLNSLTCLTPFQLVFSKCHCAHVDIDSFPRLLHHNFNYSER